MNRYDRNKTPKSNRFPIIMLLTLIGGAWIYNLYDDVQWVKNENSTLKEVISKKDEQVLQLIKIIDSLTYRPKDIIIHEEIKPKFVKKADTLTKGRDTTIKIIQPDTIKK